jgi:alcohol dehydrogenase class IV
VRGDFTWVDGERLIRFSPGALGEAAGLLGDRGFQGYALLTTERALLSAPDLADDAGIVLLVPPGEVPAAAATVRTAVEGRELVALGGGRVIDSAKAIASADGLKCAAVPTTLSGAEMTAIHRLVAGAASDRRVRPSLVIADPALTTSAPMPGLAASAMNALGHAAESLYHVLANPVTDAAALSAARLISDALTHERPDRQQLALGALLAGYALGSTGLAVHHIVSQSLVRVAGTPHAETNAVVLPHALRLMTVRAPDALGRLARAFGADSPDPDRAVSHAGTLCARAEVTTLTDLGVEWQQLDDVVQAALERPELRNTPEPPGARELKELLESAFE